MTEEITQPLQTIEEKENKALSLMQERKYREAVEMWSEVLEKKTAEKGEESIECASAFFNYGKSLLYLVQNEMDVLGVLLKKTMKKKLEGDDEEGSEEEELQTTAGVTADDLENAEEVLEIARSIYTESPEHKLELAEVYATMGDVSLEVENMEQAIRDYSQCLQIRESILAADDRRIANAHYLLALAFEYNHNVDQATSHYTMAFKLLDSKLKNCDDEEEKKELKEVVEDLSAKIEEFSNPVFTLPKQPNEMQQNQQQNAQPKIQSTHIDKVDATTTPTLPVKRKAVALPQDLEQQEKKIKS